MEDPEKEEGRRGGDVVVVVVVAVCVNVVVLVLPLDSSLFRKAWLTLGQKETLKFYADVDIKAIFPVCAK